MKVERVAGRQLGVLGLICCLRLLGFRVWGLGFGMFPLLLRVVSREVSRGY